MGLEVTGLRGQKIESLDSERSCCRLSSKFKVVQCKWDNVLCLCSNFAILFAIRYVSLLLQRYPAMLLYFYHKIIPQKEVTMYYCSYKFVPQAKKSEVYRGNWWKKQENENVHAYSFKIGSHWTLKSADTKKMDLSVPK